MGESIVRALRLTERIADALDFDILVNSLKELKAGFVNFVTRRGNESRLTIYPGKELKFRYIHSRSINDRRKLPLFTHHIFLYWRVSLHSMIREFWNYWICEYDQYRFLSQSSDVD